MRISDWSSDVCSSDLQRENRQDPRQVVVDRIEGRAAHANSSEDNRRRVSMVNGSVGPQASKKVTSCLRAPSSFHLRSRWMTSSNALAAASRFPAACSASAGSERAWCSLWLAAARSEGRRGGKEWG